GIFAGNPAKITSRSMGSVSGRFEANGERSVATALHVVARQVAQGDVSRFRDTSPDRSTQIISGRFATNGEIGDGALGALLQGIVPVNQIRQALENLHTSGNYLRILDEVATEAEQEAAQAGAGTLEAAMREAPASPDHA